MCSGAGNYNACVCCPGHRNILFAKLLFLTKRIFAQIDRGVSVGRAKGNSRNLLPKSWLVRHKSLLREQADMSMMFFV